MMDIYDVPSPTDMHCLYQQTTRQTLPVTGKKLGLTRIYNLLTRPPISLAIF